MHIAIVTAGGAGMFCGSCMHDNTWARALTAQGCEVSLIPTYTPIRVDEEDQSNPEVFLGGINVYLDYRLSFWRHIPRALTRWLDAPWLLRTASKISVSSDAHQLGSLMLAMLDGETGPQHREVAELVDFLAHRIKPDLIVFSNALLCGALKTLKAEYDGPVVCALQGDDIFLEDLLEPYRSRSLESIRTRAREFDGFLVHSQYYRDFMSQYLDLPADKFHQIPLGIDLTGHIGQPVARDDETFIVGYFARICKEKGLKELVDAFRILHREHPQVRLRAGGYLGARDADYFQSITESVRDLGDAFEYVGSPTTHDDKVAFLNSLDVLSVPTVYREPKGLYVLEALANGVPVVQPRHGAFPELIESTGGGLLVEPGNADELASALEQLMQSREQRIELAKAGQTNVRERYNDKTMASESIALFEQIVDQPATT